MDLTTERTDAIGDVLKPAGRMDQTRVEPAPVVRDLKAQQSVLVRKANRCAGTFTGMFGRVLERLQA
jgi:hypothetical protein